MPESAVILWWGADIRILAGNGKTSRLTLEGAEDPVPAILRMAGESCVAAQPLRIIYHPETLDTHDISCPNTSRSRLRKILVREFRALAAPDAVWSAEPIRRGLKGYATVLYIDKHSRLPRLLEGLAERGLPVEGVWPLQSLVEVTPPCAMAEDGFLSLVVLGGRALVSSAGPSGDRSVRFFEGHEFADAAIAEMGTVLARFEEDAVPPGLMIVEESPHAGAFKVPMPAPALNEMSLAAFLGHARILPAGGFSDFLGHKPFFDRLPAPRQMMAWAGLILMVASAWFAWAARQDRESSLRQVAASREQHAHLQEWVASRATIEGKIDELEQAVSRIQGAPQPHYELLAALDRATPKTIALQALKIQDRAFAIKGHIYEDADRPDTLPRFWRELAAPDAPWHLEDAPTTTGEADFTLRGSFQPGSGRPSLPSPAAIVPEDTPLEKQAAALAHATPEVVSLLETRLAGARARLPPAGAFDAWMQAAGRNWIVETHSAEPSADLETRHYGLAYDHPRMSSWPDIVETIRTLCAEPGVTIDSLAITAAPDGADAFQQVEIKLTVLLP